MLGRSAGLFAARRLRLPLIEPRIVLEGGSIDVNGTGALLTTEECLLSPVQARNPGMTARDLERVFGDYLGITRTLWLKNGIAGDDTHGHVDDIARFVGPDIIVCAVEDDPADANYELLQDNLEKLKRMTNANDRPFEIVTLPMPGAVGGESTDTRNLERLPASYANFYIANKVVLAPVFGHKNDSKAVETLQGLFQTRRVVPINCEPLVWGMGTIHCVTQQQPAIK